MSLRDMGPPGTRESDGRDIDVEPERWEGPMMSSETMTHQDLPPYGGETAALAIGYR
jgi:hypothetical protein